MDAHISEWEREKGQKNWTYLWDLDLLHETDAQVFQDDPIRSGEERQHVRDEVLLVRGELFPVLHVVLQIDFLCEIVVESEREREKESEESQ